MIETGHVRRNKIHLRFDAFHLGASDCLMFRELRSPWVQPCIEQLRYLLGYLTFQKSERDFCALPVQLHWRHLRGNRRAGKYKPGPWDSALTRTPEIHADTSSEK